MTEREENAKEVLHQIIDIYEGKVEDVPMTGSILCGKTADEALRIINEKKQGEKN